MSSDYRTTVTIVKIVFSLKNADFSYDDLASKLEDKVSID